MELTVRVLRKIIEGMDDNVILADLGQSNTSFNTFSNVKRLLLLKGNKQWSNNMYLTINSMGSHFTGEGEQIDLEYAKRHWDENTLNDKS